MALQRLITGVHAVRWSRVFPTGKQLFACVLIFELQQTTRYIKLQLQSQLKEHKKRIKEQFNNHSLCGNWQVTISSHGSGFTSANGWWSVPVAMHARYFQSLVITEHKIQSSSAPDTKHPRLHKVNMQQEDGPFQYMSYYHLICDDWNHLWLVIPVFDRLIAGSPSYGHSGSCRCT
jgi:hypothetical protein